MTRNEILAQQEHQQRRQERQEVLQIERRQQTLQTVQQTSNNPSVQDSARPVTPPSQSLPIRTPNTRERPRPRPKASPEAANELPTSTAPPALGREKRKRVHTVRYQQARQQGLIHESQEANRAK